MKASGVPKQMKGRLRDWLTNTESNLFEKRWLRADDVIGQQKVFKALFIPVVSEEDEGVCGLRRYRFWSADEKYFLLNFQTCKICPLLHLPTFQLKK